MIMGFGNGIGCGIVVSGVVGFAAAAAPWAWIPRRPHATASYAAPEVMGSQEGQIVLG
jgi:hypothetical protein